MALVPRSQNPGGRAPEQQRAQPGEQIERLLRQDGYPELRRIRCTWEEGRLVLLGVVSRYYYKQLALAAARKVSASCPIEDRIQVDDGGPRDSVRLQEKAHVGDHAEGG